MVCFGYGRKELSINPVADPAVSVHLECLAIFVRAYPSSGTDALERLWSIGAWSWTWPRAWPLHLDKNYALDRGVLERLARIIGFPQLTRCPIEVLDLIRRCDPSCLFWRAAETLTLAASCSRLPRQPVLTLPLPDVSSWERNGMLSRVENHNASPSDKVLITIDAAGIREIQRLPAQPSSCLSRRRSDHLAFILTDVSKLGEVNARLKSGLLSLFPPQNFWNLPILDTPSPASSELLQDSDSRIVLHIDKQTPARRIRTLDLRAITGLTFFYVDEDLHGVHAHTEEHPTALSVFKRLPSEVRRKAAWLYLPVSPEDQIDGLGFRYICRRFLRSDFASEQLLDILVSPLTTKHEATSSNKPQVPSTPFVDPAPVQVHKRLSRPTVLPRPSIPDFPDGMVQERILTEPTTFIYAEPPADSGQVNFVGAYRQPQPQPQQPEAANSPLNLVFPSESVPYPGRKPYMNPLRVNYSSAPLANVVSAEVFYRLNDSIIDNSNAKNDDSKPVFAQRFPGILFRYHDGSCWAVGQVRVGVDPSWTFVNPTHIVAEGAPDLHGVMFLPEPEGVNWKWHLAAKRTKTYPMTGEIRWWFAQGVPVVRIYQGDDDGSRRLP